MRLILIISIIFLTFVNSSFAASGTGDAAVFKVTMKKMELCTGYQGGDFHNVTNNSFCNNPVVLGTGEQVVDIASVSAGAAAASYGNAALLPLGETYTHLRVTIDKKYTIKTKDAINTGGSSDTDNCMTKSITDSSYPTGGETTNKYTHRPVVAEGGNSGSSEEMTTYFLNGEKSSTHNGSDATFVQCTNADCSKNSTVNGRTWWNTYLDTEADLASNGDSQIAQSIHRAAAATDDFVLVYKLESPYTVSLIPPTIDIAFGTEGSIGAQEVSTSAGSGTPSSSDGMCSFFIAAVDVEISIE
tara:strand:- start:107 stop:1009 length:903 start_codon:yes stop_codon:yes gene_type:complete